MERATWIARHSRGELVENGQHPQLATTLGARFEKVVGPDFVGMTGKTQRPSRVAKPSFPSLSSRQLRSFLPPDAVDPLTIDAKTVMFQHRRDDPVAIHRLLMSISPD